MALGLSATDKALKSDSIERHTNTLLVHLPGKEERDIIFPTNAAFRGSLSGNNDCRVDKESKNRGERMDVQ